jgi:hypothetical protein
LKRGNLGGKRGELHGVDSIGFRMRVLSLEQLKTEWNAEDKELESAHPG